MNSIEDFLVLYDAVRKTEYETQNRIHIFALVIVIIVLSGIIIYLVWQNRRTYKAISKVLNQNIPNYEYFYPKNEHQQPFMGGHRDFQAAYKM